MVLSVVGAVAYLDEDLQGFSQAPTSKTTILFSIATALATVVWVIYDKSLASTELDDGKVQTSAESSFLERAGTHAHLALVSLVTLGDCLLLAMPFSLSPMQCSAYALAIATGSEIHEHTSTGVDLAAEESNQDLGRSFPDEEHLLPGATTGTRSKRIWQALQTPRLVWTIIGMLSLVWALVSSARTPSDASGWTRDIAHSDDNSPADFDVVVSFYDRPVDEVIGDLNAILDLQPLRQLRKRVFIYDKSGAIVEMQEQLGAKLRNDTSLITKQLENFGREGGTYLHHIATQWDELARHTLFIQEHAHDFELMNERIADYLVPETGFMSLSYQGNLWDTCGDSRSHRLPGFSRAVAHIQQTIRPDSQCHEAILTFRGQFLASATRIRNNSRATYEQLLSDLSNMQSWMHDPTHFESGLTAGRPDSLTDPASGYVLERLWGEIMGCSEARVAFRSPSLLASYIHSVWFGRKFAAGDVQCLDVQR